MRVWVIFDQVHAAEQASKKREKQQRQQQQQVKAHGQITSANASRNDALRRCQDAQKKALAANDPKKSADATRKFYNARRKADDKARNAKATLSKLH